MQLLDNAVKLCFREGRIQKIGMHLSFVWGYVFFVSCIGPVTLEGITFRFRY